METHFHLMAVCCSWISPVSCMVAGPFFFFYVNVLPVVLSYLFILHLGIYTRNAVLQLPTALFPSKALLPDAAF